MRKRDSNQANSYLKTQNNQAHAPNPLTDRKDFNK